MSLSNEDTYSLRWPDVFLHDLSSHIFGIPYEVEAQSDGNEEAKGKSRYFSDCSTFCFTSLATHWAMSDMAVVPLEMAKVFPSN